MTGAHGQSTEQRDDETDVGVEARLTYQPQTSCVFSVGAREVVTAFGYPAGNHVGPALEKVVLDTPRTVTELAGRAFSCVDIRGAHRRQANNELALSNAPVSAWLVDQLIGCACFAQT